MPAAVDDDVGLGVDWVPLGHQFLQCRADVPVLQQRTAAPPAGPLDQNVEVGPQPDGETPLPDPRPGSGIEERAAAGCQHLRFSAKEAGDDPPFSVPECRFSKPLEDLLDRTAGGLDDLVVRIGERQPQPLRQLPADLGLAGSHQADQDDRSGGGSGIGSGHRIGRNRAGCARGR